MSDEDIRQAAPATAGGNDGDGGGKPLHEKGAAMKHVTEEEAPLSAGFTLR